MTQSHRIISARTGKLPSETSEILFFVVGGNVRVREKSERS